MIDALLRTAWWGAAGALATLAAHAARQARSAHVVERVAQLSDEACGPVVRRWRALCRRAGIDPQTWWRVSALWSVAVAFLIAWVGVRYAVTGALLVLGGRGVALVRRARGEHRRIERAIPEFLEWVAAELRAGATVPAAVLGAAQRVRHIDRSFDGVARAVAVGEPFVSALHRWPAQVPRPGVIAATAACSVAFEAGGHLAPVLEQLAQTLRDREGARAELRTQATQARCSAWIVGLAPVASLAVFLVLDPQTMLAFITAPSGRIALIVALLLELAGLWCIARIVRSEP